MWIRNKGELINCDHFIKITMAARLDTKFAIMGQTRENNYELYLFDGAQEAETKMASLLNRLNRDKK